MAWTTPTTRATGYLVTANNWNTDLVDDLAYLKGQAGIVSMEAGINSDTDNTDDLGSAALRWANIYARNVFGSRMRLNPNIREVRFPWEGRDYTIVGNVRFTSIQAGAAVATGGSINNGGSGQVVLKVDNDSAGSYARIFQETEQSSALSNHFDSGKSSYLRCGFSPSVADSRVRIFIGFRETPGISIPVVGANGEECAGIIWSGTVWRAVTGDGTTISTGTPSTLPTVGARNILEVYINSGVAVEFWLNGVKVLTKTTNLPTGELEWEFLLKGEDGGGAADDTLLTIEEHILQEAAA